MIASFANAGGQGGGSGSRSGAARVLVVVIEDLHEERLEQLTDALGIAVDAAGLEHDSGDGSDELQRS